MAFFVAREINNHYINTGDETDLKNILRFACFGINSDILLFISYITDNMKILRLIVQMANCYTSEWVEFDFERMPGFLKPPRQHEMVAPERDSLNKEQAQQLELEKKQTNELRTIDIYDYTEDKADEFINQIIRAFSLYALLSKCLPNFEHNLLKEDKDAFVNAIYKMSNKIFLHWANEVDKYMDEILSYFKEQPPEYFFQQKSKSDADIIQALQWSAMSLLLELYNVAVFHSTKENTIRYLNAFDYQSKDTYALENLMIIERQGSDVKFVDTAVKLAGKSKNPIYNTLLARIVHHAIVHMKHLDFSQQQTLTAKFFRNPDSQKLLKIERRQNEKNLNE